MNVLKFTISSQTHAKQMFTFVNKFTVMKNVSHSCYILIKSNKMQKHLCPIPFFFFLILKENIQPAFHGYDATSKIHKACCNSNIHRKTRFHTRCPSARALFSMASLFRCQNSSTCFALSAAIHPFCLSNCNTQQDESL